MHGRDPVTAPVPFATALRYWWRLGCTSFGGPAGQIALMHRDLVEERRWISERRFLHALNYCMVLPGPEAQQLATYIGFLLHGTRGAIAAGALFVLPSLVLIGALAWLYLAFGALPAVQSALWAVKPAVVAIVLHAAWRLGARTLHHPVARVVAVLAFVAIAFLDAPFPLVVLGAALAGILAGRLPPRAGVPPLGATPRHAAAAATPHRPALVDDDTPPPAHARRRPGRAWRLAGTFLLVWGGLLALLVALFGGQHTLVQMGWFFTQAALLTFGGAYAVLPWVTEVAIQQQWATLPQVLDGLALGESTPGPLIMIVAFIGFVGGWTQDALAPLAGGGLPWLGGIAGALVATLFTFLPSFLFILAGVPLVESTRDDLRVAAPLAGISAAVVGVIASLALFFGQHVLWPAGLQGPPDVPALVLGAAAFIALARFDQPVLRVLGACLAAGVAWQALS